MCVRERPRRRYTARKVLRCQQELVAGDHQGVGSGFEQRPEELVARVGCVLRRSGWVQGQGNPRPAPPPIDREAAAGARASARPGDGSMRCPPGKRVESNADARARQCPRLLPAVIRWRDVGSSPQRSRPSSIDEARPSAGGNRTNCTLRSTTASAGSEAATMARTSRKYARCSSSMRARSASETETTL